MTIHADPVARPVPGGASRPGSRGTGILPRVSRQILRQPMTVAAVVYLLGLLVLSIVIWVASPLNTNTQDIAHALTGPSAHHIFGTDYLGRDVFARVLQAAPIAVQAVGEGVGIAALIGIVPALLAGYFKGLWDSVSSRVSDVMVVFPGLVLALAIIGIMGPGLTHAMIAVGIISSPRLYRIVRAATIDIRNESYIDAAKVMGASRAQVIWTHIITNVTGPMVVQLSLVAANVLIAEAGLSYLGLGVQAPQASWGSMVSSAQPYLTSQPWAMVFPGLAIMLTVASFNVLANGIVRALRSSVGVEANT
jgi:ABC-type dipeptide/oligopeptide/nickel transport system permease subunit